MLYPLSYEGEPARNRADAGPSVSDKHAPTPSDTEAVYRVIHSRRDVRAEFTGEVIDPAALGRILAAAHAAPSVGNSQPWDFLVIQDLQRLAHFASHVADCRQRFADSLPADRRSTFDPIKIEGITESGTGIVVTYDPERGGRHVLGRHTIDDTGIFSPVLAIQNLWLAATAEGYGVGWVSFYDEAFLREFVGLPEGIRPVAWLCLGAITALQAKPDLVRFGWRQGRNLHEAIHLEQWGHTFSS